jgi:hypothetical protein
VSWGSIRRVNGPLLAVALLTGRARLADGQAPAPPPAAGEVRADAILGHQPAVQLGAGVQLALGYYVRLGLDGAVGVRLDDATARGGSASRVDGRVDLLTRFLLDPFRQSAYGLSLGGGIGLRAEPGDRVRPLLLVAVDLEGRRSRRGWSPALQLGLGGGVRAGVVLRRGAAAAR